MDIRQKIILHKSLSTDWKLRQTDAARIDLALRLLGHDDLAHKLVLTDNHTQWAAGNLAEAEAAAPKVQCVFGIEGPAETPEVKQARDRVERYQQEWWALKAKIDAVAAALEESIGLAAYAAYDEAQVPS